jgi:hypothetical protein
VDVEKYRVLEYSKKQACIWESIFAERLPAWCLSRVNRQLRFTDRDFNDR